MPERQYRQINLWMGPRGRLRRVRRLVYYTFEPDKVQGARLRFAPKPKVFPGFWIVNGGVVLYNHFYR